MELVKGTVTLVVAVAIVILIMVIGGFLTAILFNFLGGVFGWPTITWLHGLVINILIGMVGAAFRNK